MKRLFFAWYLCFSIAIQPLMAQAIGVPSPSRSDQSQAEKFAQMVRAKMPKIPSWVTAAWFKMVPKATWHRINKLFGGFDMLTIVGLIKIMRDCSDLRYYQDLIVRRDRGEEYLMDRSIKNKIVDLEKKRVIKEYLASGKNICEKLEQISAGKQILIMYRDVVIIILLIAGITLGIVFSPEIIHHYKSKLFESQATAQGVSDTDPPAMKSAELLRVKINKGIKRFQYLVREKWLQEYKIFLGESDSRTTDYLKKLGTAIPIGKTNIEGVSPIGIIAATPYIKDENRVGYIKQILPHITPTEQDKKLVDLFIWKLKKAYRPQMKGMQEFRKLGAAEGSQAAALPPGIMNIIQQELYPEYMRNPLE